MNRPDTVTIGQEVFIASPGSWDTSYKLATVSKVLKSGQITVDVPCVGGVVERRFTAKDREIGKEFRTPYLAWDVAGIKAAEAERAVMRTVEEQLSALSKKAAEFRRNYGRKSAEEALSELRLMLDNADAALKL